MRACLQRRLTRDWVLFLFFFVQNNIPDARLGCRPTLLAKRWPYSLGISNLHNLCWLLLTGLSHRLSVWAESWWKRTRCQKRKQNKKKPKNLPLMTASSCGTVTILAAVWNIYRHARLNSSILQRCLDKTGNDLVSGSSVFVLPGQEPINISSSPNKIMILRLSQQRWSWIFDTRGGIFYVQTLVGPRRLVDKLASSLMRRHTNVGKSGLGCALQHSGLRE